MKSSKNLNFVPEFFKKANVKKLILILYCVVPLLVVSIGFASWLIVGANTDSTASGTFYASDIINSYDYIVPDSDSAGSNKNTIMFYPTAFVDKDGKFQTATTIEVNFTLKLGNCAELVGNDSAKKLNAIFNLSFTSGQTFDDAFFNNLNPAITIGYGGTTYQVVDQTLQENENKTTPISNATPISNVAIVYVSKNAAVESLVSQQTTKKITMRSLTMVITGLRDSDTDDATLKIVYTLSPSVGDYQKIYEQLTADNYKLMMDVTINDYAGDTTN